jgi:hypothetical protein
MNAQTAQSQAAKSASDQGNGQAPGAEAPARPDPFANLPTVRLAEATVLDTSGLTFSAPRKYEKAHTAAIGARMPIQSGWKYSTAIFVPGSVTKEFRAGSVFGTIVDIVKRAGRQGISSYELALELRRAQVGNKRSHYCTEVPPVGWAEGYINSAVQQGLINVHTSRKAPALMVAPAAAADSNAGDGAGKSTGTNG